MSTDAVSIAAEINAEHELAFGKAREALEHARRAGELLLQAKATMGHGEWLPWLKAHCKFSARTAQGYMRLADRWKELPDKSATVAHLGLREALHMLSYPDAEERREAFAQKIRDTAERLKAVPAVPDADREFRILRNGDKKQWALQARPTVDLPYIETVFFDPLEEGLDSDLLKLDTEALVAYFLENIETTAIEDIDITGNTDDLGRREPWSFSLGHLVRGWTGFGLECGPLDLEDPPAGPSRQARSRPKEESEEQMHKRVSAKARRWLDGQDAFTFTAQDTTPREALMWIEILSPERYFDKDPELCGPWELEWCAEDILAWAGYPFLGVWLQLHELAGIKAPSVLEVGVDIQILRQKHYVRLLDYFKKHPWDPEAFLARLEEQKAVARERQGHARLPATVR